MHKGNGVSLRPLQQAIQHTTFQRNARHEHKNPSIENKPNRLTVLEAFLNT